MPSSEAGGLAARSLPQVKLAYRMWRAPALDFIVSGGATYNATAAPGSTAAPRSAPPAKLRECPMTPPSPAACSALGQVRFTAYRSDPDGGLLGPLDATHFAVGDVPGPTSRLIAGGTGRGAELTNRPLFAPAAFDRTRFEGDLPAGWDAELYRNGQLLAFAKGDGTQRYRSTTSSSPYGDNHFEIIIYGPQGQQRSRVETINVGQNHVPPGKTWYWAGVNQPGSDLLGFVGEAACRSRPDCDGVATPRLQAAASLEHGVDKRTSVAALAAMMIVGDEKLTFVEGSISRSSAPPWWNSRRAAVGRRHRPARLGDRPHGRVNMVAEAISRISSIRAASRKNCATVACRSARRWPPARPLRPWRCPLYRPDGQQTTKAAARVSAAFDRFNLTGGLEWERQRQDGNDGHISI